MSSFVNQVAVVAGASSGIGRAIALALAARGAGVWLLARRAESLEEVAVEAQRSGGRAWTCPVDVCRDEDLARFHQHLRADGAGVDILVHSAGMHALGTIGEASVSDLDALYRTNVRAPYSLTQLLLPMLRARRGQVVFVNSSVGLRARAAAGAYSATQHARKALADALREEVNADGVRVVSVYPGRTATPLQAAIHRQEGRTYQPERLLQPADVAAAVVHALGMERTAEVTDIQVRPMLKP